MPCRTAIRRSLSASTTPSSMSRVATWMNAGAGVDQCPQSGAAVLLLGVYGGQGQGHRRPGAGWARSGAKAAELVNAILEGAQPKTLAPRAALRGEYVFSKSELARWQLTLPDKWRYKILWRD